MTRDQLAKYARVIKEMGIARMRCRLSISGRGLFRKVRLVSGNVPVAVAARMAPRILPGGPGPDPLYEQTGRWRIPWMCSP